MVPLLEIVLYCPFAWQPSMELTRTGAATSRHAVVVLFLATCARRATQCSAGTCLRNGISPSLSLSLCVGPVVVAADVGMGLQEPRPGVVSHGGGRLTAAC